MIKKYKEQPEKNKNTKIQGKRVFQMARSQAKNRPTLPTAIKMKRKF